MRLTWILWHALIWPPENHPVIPLTFRIMTPAPVARRGCWRVLHWIMQVVTVIFIAICILGFVASIPAFIVGLIKLILDPYGIPILVVFPLFFSAFVGLSFVGRITKTIHQMQIQHTYELYSLIPAGPLILSWLVCVGCHHFKNYLSRSRLFIHISFAVICAMLMFNLGIQIGDLNVLTLAYILIFSLIIVYGQYLDMVQNVVLGCMIGIFTPTFMDDSQNHFNWSSFLHLTIQGVVYGLSLFVSDQVGWLLYILNVSNAGSLVLLPVRLLIFFGVMLLTREMFMRLLWQVIVRRCHTTHEDLEYIRTLRSHNPA